MRLSRFLSSLMLSISLGLAGGEMARAVPQEKVTFEDHLLPLLREKCLSCHNPDRAKGGLSMSTYGALMEGGSSGAVVEPGDPGASRLYALVAHAEKPTMPPNSERLPEASLKVFESWIAGGALENRSSRARPKRSGLKLDGGVVETGKPSGPPAMPAGVSLQPIDVPARPHPVIALASSPWAPVVAAGGSGQVFLYHARSQRLLGVLAFPEGVPQVLRFSRNGKLLLAGGGQGARLGKVVVWDLGSGDRVLEIGDELDSVLAADISADLTRVALGGPGKVVRVFDATTGEVLARLTAHTEWIRALEFSPDGVLLATGDRNGGLRVWEALTGREYLDLKGHPASITGLSWRLDSDVLASTGEDGTVKLWEMENGNQVRSWNAHGGGSSSVRYYRDGRLVTAGRDRRVKLWDGGGKLLMTTDALPDLALQAVFSHDGQQILAGDWTGHLGVWAIGQAKPLLRQGLNPARLEDRLAVLEAEFEKRRGVADGLRGRVGQLEGEVKGLREKLAASKRVTEELTPRVAEAGQKLGQLREASRQARQAYVTVSEAIEKKTSEKEAPDGELERLRNDLEAALERSRGASQELIELDRTRRAQEGQLEAARAEIEKATPRLEKLTPELEKVRAELVKRDAELEEVRQELEHWQLAAELEKLHTRRREESQALSELRGEIEETRGEAGEVESDIESVREDLSRLERELARLRERLEKRDRRQADQLARLEALREEMRALGLKLLER